MKTSIRARLEKAGFWVLALLRHYVRQPGILIPFAGIVTGTFLLSLSEISLPVQIRAAVCTDGSVFAERVYRQLSDSDSIIQFYLCGDEEQMNRDVASGKAECGYVLDENIEFQLKEVNLEDIIESRRSPGTIVKGMADELVFAGILSVYSPQLYADYISDTLIAGSTSRQEMARTALREYETYRNNNSTFRFGFSGETECSGETGSSALIRLRGIIAVMILAGSLCAVAAFKRDDSLHLFLCAEHKLFVEITSYTIAILVLGIIGLAGLRLTVEWSGLLTELRAMSVYAVLLLGFCLLTSHLLRTEAWVITFIPPVTAGSLILAPVFVDLSMFLPLIGLLKWVTPVSVYLSLI